MFNKKNISVFIVLLVVLSVGIILSKIVNKKNMKMKELKVMSHSFKEGEEIPVLFTCDGQDISPHLMWEKGPEGTRGYVMIMDDPDAPKGTWVHWVVFNISSTVTKFDQGSDLQLADAVMGKNSWGKNQYGGPCPPSGTHRYYFKIYALDTQLDLDESAAKEDVISAMKGHVVAQGSLMGRYSKK